MAENMLNFWQTDAIKVAGASIQAASPPSPGPSAPGPSDAQESTGAEIFFKKNSAELTASATKSLDAYAKAYVAAKSSEPVTVDGYASTEGEAKHNQKLSEQRAQAVADYLTKQGVPKVTPKGHGATDSFGKADLQANRRATLKPPPPKPASTSPPFDMRMRKKPDLTLDLDDLEKIPHTPPSKTVKREEVKKALEKFLLDVGKVQKHKDNVVTSSDKVWQADMTLHKDVNSPLGPYTPTGGDKKSYQASELAEKMAQRLPDEIPKENFEKFLKMTPTETELPGSVTDQIRKKYEEKRDGIVNKLPKKLQGIAKKGMDAAISKGIPYVLDQALKETDLPEGVEDAMKKIVEDYTKEITGDKKK
jgi:outer membrane protein OmpA-like peptidoglycan-associated protein